MYILELSFDFSETCLKSFDVPGELGEEDQRVDYIVVPGPLASLGGPSFDASSARNLSIAFYLACRGIVVHTGIAEVPRSAVSCEKVARAQGAPDNDCEARTTRLTFLRLHSEHEGNVAEAVLSGKLAAAMIDAEFLLASLGPEAAASQEQEHDSAVALDSTRTTAVRTSLPVDRRWGMHSLSARARFAGRASRGLTPGGAVSSVVNAAEGV